MLRAAQPHTGSPAAHAPATCAPRLNGTVAFERTGAPGGACSDDDGQQPAAQQRQRLSGLHSTHRQWPGQGRTCWYQGERLPGCPAHRSPGPRVSSNSSSRSSSRCTALAAAPAAGPAAPAATGAGCVCRVASAGPAARVRAMHRAARLACVASIHGALRIAVQGLLPCLSIDLVQTFRQCSPGAQPGSRCQLFANCGAVAAALQGGGG